MINKLTKEQRHRCMSTIKERNKEEDKKNNASLLLWTDIVLQFENSIKTKSSHTNA